MNVRPLIEGVVQNHQPRELREHLLQELHTLDIKLGCEAFEAGNVVTGMRKACVYYRAYSVMGRHCNDRNSACGLLHHARNGGARCDDHIDVEPNSAARS